MTATQNKKNQVTKAPEVEFRNAADFKSIYVNYIQTAASPADISIVAGETIPTSKGIPDVEMKVRLVVSPIQAKIMLGMLFQVVQQYEKRYSKIVIPPAVLAQLSTDLRAIAATDNSENP